MLLRAALHQRRTTPYDGFTTTGQPSVVSLRLVTCASPCSVHVHVACNPIGNVPILNLAEVFQQFSCQRLQQTPRRWLDVTLRTLLI